MMLARPKEISECLYDKMSNLEHLAGVSKSLERCLGTLHFDQVVRRFFFVPRASAGEHQRLGVIAGYLRRLANDHS